MDARNPERFDRIKISATGSAELVQQGDILTHIADAATARAGRQKHRRR